MELWIRSQDREYLEKVEKIYIWKNSFEEYQIDGKGELGTYKTKERALEVLDEIQNILMPIITSTPIIEEDIKPEYTYRHYVSKGSDIEVMQLNTYVYEMPKE